MLPKFYNGLYSLNKQAFWLSIQMSLLHFKETDRQTDTKLQNTDGDTDTYKENGNVYFMLQFCIIITLFLLAMEDIFTSASGDHASTSHVPQYILYWIVWHCTDASTKTNKSAWVFSQNLEIWETAQKMITYWGWRAYWLSFRCTGGWILQVKKRKQ